jgi:hypothetical protein
VGTQLEHHVWNPHHGEPSDRKRLAHDTKGPGAEVSRSSMCDMSLTQPFQALIDIFKNTTEELYNIAAQYATSNEVVQLRLTPSNGKEASSAVTIQDDEEGGRKRCKQLL